MSAMSGVTHGSETLEDPAVSLTGVPTAADLQPHARHNNHDDDDEKNRLQHATTTTTTLQLPPVDSNWTHDEKKLDDQHEALTKRKNHNFVWRDCVGTAPFPAETGRYHLYVSYACPGSHRVLAVRALKGLEDCISVTYLHPVWRLTGPVESDKHRGWVFGNPHGQPFSNTIGRGGPFPAALTETLPDPVDADTYSIRQVYERCGDSAGKYTIPILYDTVQNTIVNNEASDIAYMLNSSFNEFATQPALDLYQGTYATQLQECNDWMAPLMIHGVYRCGFAKTQRAYDTALTALVKAFDRAAHELTSQRFLTGERITDADLRLFVTLMRFDEVYAVYFKANARLVVQTPVLLNFCRDLYRMPGIAETCRMDHIKAHFYASHAEWNKYSIIPTGLDFMSQLQQFPPVGREELMHTAVTYVENEDDNDDEWGEV